MKNVRTSSYFNQVDLGDGRSLLFSGSTLCMDLIPEEYAKLLSEGADISFLSPEEKHYLLERGHLTNLTPNRELAEFRKTVGVISNKISESNKKLKRGNVSFILTYNCNLSCSYCYQNSLPDKTKTHVMTEELVDDLFTNCLPQLFPEFPDHFLFTLFGGEPLLPGNRKAITRILHYAEKYPSVRINVATNATALTEMLDLIGPEKGKIQSVQVTLDGDKLLHDETRIPHSGKPTFDAMITAVRQLIQTNTNVGIRIHIHPKKLESAKKLVDYLEEEALLGHPQVTVYFSPINTFTSEENSPEDYDSFCKTFQNVAAKTARPPSYFIYMKKFMEMQAEKILPIVNYCGLGGDSFFVIDPLGDIYQCYEEAGHRERRVGTFINGKVRYFALREKYSRRNLLNLPECIRCSMALFCGGGCPIQARNTKGSIFKPYCHLNKEFIGQTLRAFFLKNERGKEGK